MSFDFDAQIPREPDPASGLPIGPRVAITPPFPAPGHVVLDGRFCRLEPLDAAKHGDDLFRAATPPDAASRFVYLFEDPPTDRAEFSSWLAKVQASTDPLFFAVIDKRTGKAEGRQTLMRIDAPNGVIETGSIYWGPAISRSPVSTEANYLFAKYVFDTLGYRRFEWKCNALNAPSRAAAERFGFRYEGFFRRAVIIKGRTRDTTWFSMIAEDWPQINLAYETWLAPANFDAKGQQRLKLSALTETSLTAGEVTLRRGAATDGVALESLQAAAYAPNRAILGVEPIPTQLSAAQILATKEVWLTGEEADIDAALILEPYPDQLTIWSIATAPAGQKQRLGSKLLAAAETRARRLGIPEIRLYTGTKLTHLVAWYTRNGYVTDRIEERADRSITHMRKRLSA